MPADKLQVYNKALQHLGSRRIASLTEDREPRRALDDAWADGVTYCLEQGVWGFATRSVELASDPSIDPGFGFPNAFRKPDGWLKTVAIARDDNFRDPETRYVDEDGYWFADGDALFVRFVSTEPSYGFDLSRWPASFTDFVALRLAVMTCKRITGSDDKAKQLQAEEAKARKTAKSNDSWNKAPARPPVGEWVKARFAGGARSRENG